MTSGPPSKRDLRQEITDQIIRALEQGTAPWQKPWQAGALELPFNPATGKPYRGGNVIQLMIEASSQGYDDPRWLTYSQAHENGWQVRRGEQGTHVEFWQFPDRTTRPGSEGRPDVAEAQRDSFIYRVYTVFNAKQLDGIPPHSPRVRQEWEVLQSAQAILDSSGARIQHDQSDRAFYNRRTDTIHLPPKAAFKTAGDYFATAIHETCHWSGHPARLNRETLNESYRFGDLNYAREELRAELASVFLLAERGIPHNTESHAAYLNSWLETLRNDRHEIFRAARDAHKAADLLLQLELHKSLDKALAEVNQPSSLSTQIVEPELKAPATARLAFNGSESHVPQMEL
jgi:antirestriction protein ArdC